LRPQVSGRELWDKLARGAKAELVCDGVDELVEAADFE
jgi:hypothetical protein